MMSFFNYICIIRIIAARKKKMYLSDFWERNFLQNKAGK